MLKAICSTDDLSKEQWLELRKTGIGGSDASVVCGMNKYKSPFELWQEKTGRVEAKEAGEKAYWGNLLEPFVKEEFEKRSSYKVYVEKVMLQHPKYPFMLANIDGMIFNEEYPRGCLFEAKTASAYLEHEWEDGKVPEAYMLQVQHYLAVTNFVGAYIAVLIGGNKFKWTFIPRDEEIIEMLIKIEGVFWEYVKNDTTPPIDGSEASTHFIQELYKFCEKNSSIELPSKAEKWINEYQEAQEIEKEMATRKNEVANKLKAMLGNSEIGTLDKRIVSWKNVETDKFDTTSFKVEHPDLYSQYLKKSSYRRFIIK
jgi:putative phage-type endonuclease